MSLIGAFTHLGQVSQYRRLWIQSVGGYTFAGLLSATTVGAVLGGLGGWLGRPLPREDRFLIVAFLALLLVARELGWIAFPLPSRRRQTEKWWANQFGLRAAAVMWGFDIGTSFSTWVHYGGFWIVVAVIAAAGDARYGAVLMGSYWLGRALPVWFSPWVLKDGRSFSLLFTNLRTESVIFRRINTVGLAWSAGIVLLMTGTQRAKIMAWIIDGVNDLGSFYISYILIWGLTLIPAVLLHRVLREIVWLSQQRDDLMRQAGVNVSGPVPHFSARLLGKEKTLTSRDFAGQETTLLFIRPEDARQELDKQLHTSAHALWHKANGNLFAVCSGNAEGCQQLLPELQLSETINIPVLLDQDGAIARAFHVNCTPMAFRLDAEARLVGSGRQISSIPLAK